MPEHRRTLPPSAHIGIASQSDVRAILKVLKPLDLTVLEPALESRLQSALWRTTFPMVLPTLGSVFMCNYNVEPAGLMVVERSQATARIRLLAVAPDLRRKNIASKMLHDLEPLVASRQLHWLWAEIPSDNLPATRLALSSGYRRYQPQFLRRDVPTMLHVRPEGVALEPLGERGVVRAVTTAMQVEAEAGDPWALELIEAELIQRIVVPAGQTYVCFVQGNGAAVRTNGDQNLREVGLAHLSTTNVHTTLRLWLDQDMWGSAAELALIKTLLNTLLRVPPVIDVRLGSGGHLRASAPNLKALGFVPMLEPRIIFAKRLTGKG